MTVVSTIVAGIAAAALTDTNWHYMKWISAKTAHLLSSAALQQAHIVECP
jgi:hypothetical protein